MEAKAEPRFRKRLPCRVRANGSSQAGMVLNLSRGGLFVQTSAGPPPGAGVWIDLDVANHLESVVIGARVVWRRAVAPHLRTISHGGIGVRIDSAPEAYYRFLSVVSGGTPAPRPSGGGAAGPEEAPRSDPPKTGFRVRVKHEGGPRSRTMTLHCEDGAEARRRALARLGAGWVVLEVERFP